jgi:FkbM family methyltransferase
MSGAFGTLAPSATQEYFRKTGHRLPQNYFGRKCASLLLGPAGGRADRAYDVEIFGTQKARLHPFDNICEKRVYLTPQLWDGAERAVLRDAIAAYRGNAFSFVDVGANVGLYSLFARAAAASAGVRLAAICVEADPEMAARLRFNVEASGAEQDIALVECAASDSTQPVKFHVDRNSRGLSRVSEEGDLTVTARPLLSILTDAGARRIDAMKLDIEGHEHRALCAFFRDAPATLHPGLIILETSHASDTQSAERLALGKGYRTVLRTVRNSVMVREDQPPG